MILTNFNNITLGNEKEEKNYMGTWLMSEKFYF